MLYPYFSTLSSLHQVIIVMIAALFFTIFFGKKGIQILYALKIGQPIRYANFPKLFQLHEKKKDTPTMGGVIHLVIFLFFGLLLFDFHRSTAWMYLVAFAGLSGLGIVDDYHKLKGTLAKGISSKTKLVIQFLIAICLLAGCSYFDENGFNHYFLRASSSFWGIVFSYLFFVFAFTGSSNAVNLTDGLDGLASGVIAIVSFGLIVLVLNQHSNVIEPNALIALAIISGMSIGFLWYNQFPAQVFMGDTGSLSHGGLLALIAFTIQKEWFYALMGIIFVLEAVSVILQVGSYRLRNQKRVFLCAPLHHHYQYQGMHEVKIVTRFWLITIFSTLSAFLFV